LIIGIGASAGGLDAFKSFFAHVPSNTGMAFVLVQHLDPHHESMLVELLGRHTAMTVTEAEDRMPVVANRVFVIPPNATLTIKDSVLHVMRPAPAREHRRPIDTFFCSLAEDQGESAVCIVLSGTGSDGTVGLSTIKEHGGLTLAQAEFDSTAMSGMPQSAAATGLVDHIMPVETMPATLVEYHRHLIDVAGCKDADGNRSDTVGHLSTITALLRVATGHDFSHYKQNTLIRRVQRRMQVLQIDTAPAFIERLRMEPREVQLLFREFLIGVTQFFRDPHAFDALRATVLPKLLETKGADSQVRIWVPGCATGEEVYSIGIVLREAMEALGATP
jgi:two-component system CheB/CheR fusion protein